MDPRLAQALIAPSASVHDVDMTELDKLWRIIDYCWLSDANRTGSPFWPMTPLSADLGNWSFFEDFLTSEHNLGRGNDHPADIFDHTVQQGISSTSSWNNRAKDCWLNFAGTGSPSGQMFGFNSHTQRPT